MESANDNILICDRATLAKYFGLTVGRITQLTREGVMVKVSRGRYDAPESLARFIDFKIQGGASGTRDVTEARKRLYDAQTHKVELESDRVKREHIPSDQHLADLREIERIFNQALDNLDAGLADDLAELSSPAEINDRLMVQTNSLRLAVADSITEYAATV